MRITGGKLAGRKIDPPSSTATRPMMDRTRQALFNILRHHDWGPGVGNVLDGTNVLDGFCGTGAIAFEAISHGARHATLFDKEPQALDVARSNAQKLSVNELCSFLLADTLAPPKTNYAARLIFLCPPYNQGLIAPALVSLHGAGWCREKALFVLETQRNERLELPMDYAVLLERNYSDTSLLFVSK